MFRGDGFCAGIVACLDVSHCNTACYGYLQVLRAAQNASSLRRYGDRGYDQAVAAPVMVSVADGDGMERKWMLTNWIVQRFELQ